MLLLLLSRSFLRSQNGFFFISLEKQLLSVHFQKCCVLFEQIRLYDVHTLSFPAERGSHWSSVGLFLQSFWRLVKKVWSQPLNGAQNHACARNGSATALNYLDQTGISFFCESLNSNYFLCSGGAEGSRSLRKEAAL